MRNSGLRPLGREGEDAFGPFGFRDDLDTLLEQAGKPLDPGRFIG